LVLAAAVAVAALSVPAIASAHTGSIETQQDCSYGTRVVAHLDDNVADTATWELTINGDVKDSGTGPGPADLGPYVAGHSAGDAKLTIDYGQEKNVYTVSWGKTSPCDLEVHGGGNDPRAKITGPCGDPLYRWTLKAGTERAVFTIHVKLYGKGWRTFTRTVAGGHQITSAYKHVLGNTLITISANGKVIKSKQSAPGGWYGACAR
jgi:hypothetical protein